MALRDFSRRWTRLVSRSAWPRPLLDVFGDGARREVNLQLQQQLIGNAFSLPKLDSQLLTTESAP